MEKGAEVRIRRMERPDVGAVMEIAQSLPAAPHWPAAAYLAALDPEGMPQRVALVALDVGGDGQEHSSWAKQAAERLGTEGGGGFNLRINPAGSAGFSGCGNTRSGEGYGLQPVHKPSGMSRALQSAEKLGTEGGGGVNPRIKPAESAGFSPGRTVLRDLPETIRPFSAASKAQTILSGLSAPLKSCPDTKPVARGFSASDEAVVGFAIASLVTPQAELEMIAVASEAQRQGVAGRLFVALTQELRLAGVTEIILEVRISNQSALSLYRQSGFRETGLRRGYYADPVEDAVLMSLSIGFDDGQHSMHRCDSGHS